VHFDVGDVGRLTEEGQERGIEGAPGCSVEVRQRAVYIENQQFQSGVLLALKRYAIFARKSSVSVLTMGAGKCILVFVMTYVRGRETVFRAAVFWRRTVAVGLRGVSAVAQRLTASMLLDVEIMWATARLRTNYW
jgi:hypothetical protein